MKSLPPDAPSDPVVIVKFERCFDDCLELAGAEYKIHPPMKYYREGYNLSLRLRKYKESELLFLHDLRVPPDNSLCERLARVFKRKMHQAIAFRSTESLSSICDALGKINDMRTLGKDVFVETSAISNLAKPVA